VRTSIICDRNNGGQFRDAGMEFDGIGGNAMSTANLALQAAQQNGQACASTHSHDAKA
jgi:hypothetical protein